MDTPINKTIGTWRVQPLPQELKYASPAATPARTRSGFGVASLVLGCVLTLVLIVVAVRMVPWSSDDGDRIALAALPVSLVGAGLGVTGSVRRSRRRLPGVLGT
jgi:hypothetical protein